MTTLLEAFSSTAHLPELPVSGLISQKVAGLLRLNLVQQGGALAYLLPHDPEYRYVGKEHLIEVGRRVRLKRNIGPLTWFLQHGIDGHCPCLDGLRKGRR